MESNHKIVNTWSIKVVNEPSAEPLTLAEAKIHLRVDFTDDDAYITALIIAARQIVEQHTNRALITQTLDYFLDDFPRCDDIQLRKPSLQSVTNVNYTDSSGVEHIMDPNDYVVDFNAIPGRIFLKYARIWPIAILQPASAVRIRMICGYGDTADKVPAALKQAMLILISQFYENREPLYIGKPGLAQTPMTYTFLIAPYKVVMLQ